MGDLFKALTSGIARFVYAWLMPSVVTSGVFLLVVLPNVVGRQVGASLGGVAAFTLAVLGLSVVFAYASRPLYQFLEGYTMPTWMARPLLRRSQRKFVRLRVAESRGPELSRQRATEDLKGFPERLDLLMPTRLGNALKAMESYGVSRFGLDSQTFWYELQAVADERVRQSTEETRAAVDFFMSSVAHLALLAVVSFALAPLAQSPLAVLGVAAAAAALAPVAYAQAVRNVGEWRWAVQALVNTSRPALAKALALSLPATYEEEHALWTCVSGLVHHGAHGEYLQVLNRRRAIRDTLPTGTSDGALAGGGDQGSGAPEGSGSDRDS